MFVRCFVLVCCILFVGSWLLLVVCGLLAIVDWLWIVVLVFGGWCLVSGDLHVWCLVCVVRRVMCVVCCVLFADCKYIYSWCVWLVDCCSLLFGVWCMLCVAC